MVFAGDTETVGYMVFSRYTVYPKNTDDDKLLGRMIYIERERANHP